MPQNAPSIPQSVGSLEAMDPEDPNTHPAPGSEYRRCPACEETNYATAPICAYCGSPLHTVDDEAAAAYGALMGEQPELPYEPAVASGDIEDARSTDAADDFFAAESHQSIQDLADLADDPAETAHPPAPAGTLTDTSEHLPVPDVLPSIPLPVGPPPADDPADRPADADAGADQLDVASPTPDAAAADAPASPVCSSCGAIVGSNAPFCSSCGADFASTDGETGSDVLGTLRGPAGLSEPIAGTVSVGRDPRNTLALADQAVSRAHCRFDSRGGTVLLTDTGSMNGTWLNGRRVTREELSDGDVILIGRTELHFEASASEPQGSPDSSTGTRP